VSGGDTAASIAARFRGTGTARVVGVRLLRGFVFLNISILVVNAGAYAYQLLASRGLGVAGYGLWNSFLSFYLIAYIPGWTVNLVVARRVAELSTQNAGTVRAYAQTMTLRVGSVLVGALVVLLALCPVAHPLARSIPLAALILVVVATITNLALPLPLGGLQGLQEFGQLSFVMALRSALALILGGLLVVLGAGLPGVLGGLVLGNLGALLVGAAMLARLVGSGRRPMVSVPKAPAASVSENYLTVTATYAFVTVMLYVDTLFAQHFLGAEEAGRYAVVAVASRIIFFAPYAVMTIVVPRVAAHTAARRDTRPLLAGGILLTVAATLPFVAAYAVAPRRLLRLFFGPAYASSPVADLLPRYAVAVALLALTFFLVHYFMACRRHTYLVALAAGLVALALCLTVSHSRASDLVRAILLGNAVAAGLLTGLAVATSLRQPQPRLQPEARGVPATPSISSENYAHISGNRHNQR